ncbi:MAG: molecular chaperone HtpG, partial [Oleibacter sp.]|nr:molecular chaperone HtpG [Thalassolituus sp.]
WNQFGEILKEAPAEDYTNREKVAGLYRFATTQSEGKTQTEGLADYVARMKEGQKKIYFITGDNHDAVAASPHLEYFRRKGVEVLLLTDRVDEWMVGHLNDFDGKAFQDVTKGELDLDELADDAEKEEQKHLEEAHKDLVERMMGALEDEIKEVRVSSRLTDSPACLVVGQYDMGGHLRRMMEAAGQAVPEPEMVLEINPEHPLIKRLDSEQNEDRFRELAQVIHAQAQLAEGSQLKQPAQYVSRLNKLLLDLMQ